MVSQFIKVLALVSLLGIVGGRVMADEPAPAAPQAAAEHAEHKDHKHVHGSKDCKHKKEQHGDHEDYEHKEGKAKVLKFIITKCTMDMQMNVKTLTLN